MIVTELQPDDATEPVWDWVGVRGCDFRPHFDGHLHNLFTTIYPLDSRDVTESAFKDAALKIANWILENRSSFQEGDRFQIIVGWPLDVRTDSRQCIKIGGTLHELQVLVQDGNWIQFRDGWDKSVFDSNHMR